MPNPVPASVNDPVTKITGEIITNILLVDNLGVIDAVKPVSTVPFVVVEK
jgi:hypothetical protein